jgi:hypothetical protein
MTATETMPRETYGVKPIGRTELVERNGSAMLRRGLTEALSIAGLEAGHSLRWIEDESGEMLVGVGLEYKVDGRAEPRARPIREENQGFVVSIPPAVLDVLGIDDVDELNGGRELELFATDGLIAIAPVQEREIVVDVDS